jgi:hypothetical protein
MTRRDLLALVYLLETEDASERVERVIRAKVFDGSARSARRLAHLRGLGLVVSEPTGRGVGINPKTGTGLGVYRPGPHVWDVTLKGANAAREHLGLPKLSDWEPRLVMPR